MKFFASALVSVLLGGFAFATEPETYTYDIKGMTCEDCVANVKKGVCGMKGIEKCEVNAGHMTLTTTAGATLNQKKIAAAVKKAGHYKVESFKKVDSSAATTATAPSDTPAEETSKK